MTLSVALHGAQHHEYAATPILPFVETIPHDESRTWYVGYAISKCANIVFWGACYRVPPLWLVGPIEGTYWGEWDHTSVGHK